MLLDADNPLTIVELYYADFTVLAGLPVPMGERLSEWINSLPGELTTVLIGEIGQSDEMPRREAVIRVRDVRYLRPLYEPSSAQIQSSLIMPRVPVRVWMMVSPFQFTGDIHLMDRTRWVDYLMAQRSRFIPMTDATVETSAGGAVRAGNVMINATFMSIFSEVG